MNSTLFRSLFPAVLAALLSVASLYYYTVNLKLKEQMEVLEEKDEACTVKSVNLQEMLRLKEKVRKDSIDMINMTAEVEEIRQMAKKRFKEGFTAN